MLIDSPFNRLIQFVLSESVDLALSNSFYLESGHFIGTFTKLLTEQPQQNVFIGVGMIRAVKAKRGKCLSILQSNL